MTSYRNFPIWRKQLSKILRRTQTSFIVISVLQKYYQNYLLVFLFICLIGEICLVDRGSLRQIHIALSLHIFLNSVLRPFQDHFSSYETGHSVSWAKKGEPREKPWGASGSKVGLSHILPSAGREHTRHSGEMILTQYTYKRLIHCSVFIPCHRIPLIMQSIPD